MTIMEEALVTEVVHRVENLIIGIGMGWDLDILVKITQTAIDDLRIHYLATHLES